MRNAAIAAGLALAIVALFAPTQSWAASKHQMVRYEPFGYVGRGYEPFGYVGRGYEPFGYARRYRDDPPGAEFQTRGLDYDD
jgi:hypothetical protein